MWKRFAASLLSGAICVPVFGQFPAPARNIGVPQDYQTSRYVQGPTAGPSLYGSGTFSPPPGYMPLGKPSAYGNQHVGLGAPYPAVNPANQYSPAQYPAVQNPTVQNPTVQNPTVQNPTASGAPYQVGVSLGAPNGNPAYASSYGQARLPQFSGPVYLPAVMGPNGQTGFYPSNFVHDGHLGEPGPDGQTGEPASVLKSPQLDGPAPAPNSDGPQLVGPQLVGPQLVGPQLVGPQLVGPQLVGPGGYSQQPMGDHSYLGDRAAPQTYGNDGHGMGHGYAPGSTLQMSPSYSEMRVRPYTPATDVQDGITNEGMLFGAPPAPSACDLDDCDPDLDFSLQPAWNNGWFFQYDHLLWTFEAPEVTTIGDDASERLVNIGGVTVFHENSLNTAYIDYDVDNADRIEFGVVEQGSGWMAGIIYGQMHHSLAAEGVNFVPSDPGASIEFQYLAGYQDSNGDGIDDDIDADVVHGRHGRDLGTPDTANPGAFILPFDGIPDEPVAPPDFGDLVRYLVTFNNFSTRNQVTMTGFELMRVKRVTNSPCSRFDFFYGARYLNIEDDFSANGSGGVLDRTYWDLAVQNRIIGPQFGGRFTHRYKSWAVNLEGRAMLGCNFQDGVLQGQLATETNNVLTGQNEPVALIPTAFNHNRNNTEFSPVGEWRAESLWDISDRLTFRVGYTGTVIDGFSYASPKVVYVLPTLGLSDRASSETVFSHAISFGFDLAR
jgi:hypothetical protein